MDFLTHGLIEALRLIASFDRELVATSLVSLKIAAISTLLSTALGVPLGAAAALAEFPGKRFAGILLNTLMALPTVVVGLLVYSFLSRQGPLGSLGILYTQTAMVMGQCVLITPIVAALSLNVLTRADVRVRTTAFSLGATPLRAAWTVVSEYRVGLVCAVAAGFGRAFAEVGVSMMLGGNIRWYTRNLTTAIAFETSRGEFAMGLALGMILLSVAFAINILLQALQGDRT